MDLKTDLTFIGLGASTLLTAKWLLTKRPELKISVVETDIGRELRQTLCCFESDLDHEQSRFLTELGAQKWSRSHVVFEGFDVTQGTYIGLNDRLLNKLRSELLPKIELINEHANLKDRDLHRRYKTKVIINCAGAPNVNNQKVAYQKFVGLTLKAPNHGLENPIIMDTRCEQKEGFRFFYCLPWDQSTVLVEDTRYENSNILEIDEYTKEIHKYWSARYSGKYEVISEEQGRLLLPLEQNYYSPKNAYPALGVQGNWFHPTTSYGLAQYLEVAKQLSSLTNFNSNSVQHILQETARNYDRSKAFFRFLNRILFRSLQPDQRLKLFRRFYTLPEQTIEAFYRGRIGLKDMATILFYRRPPLGIGAAMKQFIEERP